jgi:hypothetical protein
VLSSPTGKKLKKSFDRFRTAKFRATSRRQKHILKKSLIAKEADIMITHTMNVGDIDDLIFQDSWVISDR